MTRIVYVLKGFEYNNLQRVKIVIVYNHSRSPPNKEHEFCVERFRTTYHFLVNLIVLKEKINPKYFDMKLNGWNEVSCLHEKIPDRRYVCLYFITNNKYKHL